MGSFPKEARIPATREASLANTETEAQGANHSRYSPLEEEERESTTALFTRNSGTKREREKLVCHNYIHSHFLAYLLIESSIQLSEKKKLKLKQKQKKILTLYSNVDS